MKREIRVARMKNPRYPFRVRTWDGDGKRKDSFFTNETEALGFAKAQREQAGMQGTNFGHVTEEERAALLFWRQFVKDASATPPNLVSVLRDFKTSWLASTASLTVSAAVERFLDHQEAAEASPRHLASLKSRLSRFAADHAEAKVSAITTNRFTEWLNALRSTRADKPGAKLSQTTRHNFTRTLRSFFAFAVEQGWTLSNPIPKEKRSKSRAVKLATHAAPSIMLPGDVARFMAAVQSEVPALAPFWALKFFAGIRDSEAAEMNWTMIDLTAGEIHLPASIAKTAELRTVKIQPCLAAWLASSEKRTGRIAPSDTTRKRGFKKAMAAVPDLKFPSNAARHSFGTFHLYHFRDAGETALQLGHKGNPAMLHTHYKNPAAEKHAAAFWTITPEAAGNVVPMTGRRTA